MTNKLKRQGVHASFKFYNVGLGKKKSKVSEFATKCILLVLRHSSALHPCLIFIVKQEREEVEGSAERLAYLGHPAVLEGFEVSLCYCLFEERLNS